MDPMPSGGAGEAGAEGAGAAELEAGLAQEDANLGRAGAVLPAGAAGAGESGGRARPRAEAAMQAAAAVRHGGLAALPAAAGAGATTRRCQEIAGAVAVPQPAAAVGWEVPGGGPGPVRLRTVNPMPSGRRWERSGRGGGHLWPRDLSVCSLNVLNESDRSVKQFNCSGLWGDGRKTRRASGAAAQVRGAADPPRGAAGPRRG